LGRKKKTEVEVEVEVIVAPNNNKQLQKHTKLIKKDPVVFSEQYKTLMEKSWFLVEVKGNAYYFACE
jgi:hypothetical protein